MSFLEMPKQLRFLPTMNFNLLCSTLDIAYTNIPIELCIEPQVEASRRDKMLNWATCSRRISVVYWGSLLFKELNWWTLWNLSLSLSVQIVYCNDSPETEASLSPGSNSFEFKLYQICQPPSKFSLWMRRILLCLWLRHWTIQEYYLKSQNENQDLKAAEIFKKQLNSKKWNDLAGLARYHLGIPRT